MSTRSTRKSATPSTSTSHKTVSSSQVTTSSTSERPTSPLSPTRVSRMQEKLDLQNLNDRLAAYIDRVRFLESENSRLSVQVQTSQETITREVSNIKSMYEKELSDARKLLDDTARDKARLQIESTKWKNEYDEAHTKLNKKEKELTSTSKKLVNVESHNQDIQSRLNQITAEKKRLDDALKEAQTDRDKFAAQLNHVKAQLEEETVFKVDLLNRLQSVKEEMSFKETIHEREMTESRVLKHTEVSDLDLNLKEHYEQKLADTLREIRDQYELQMKINRDEIETLYESKIVDLQNLCDQYSSGVNKSRDEVRGLKNKFETMTTKIGQLESQNESLQTRIKDLENMIQQERQWHQLGLEKKDEELKSIREDLERQLQEYQDLLDIKIALDMEIIAYRKLLEVEESRLNITPLKATTIGDVQRSTPRRTPLRGKRKRTVFQSGEQSTSELQSSATAKGDVEVNDHDPEGKFVKLFNKGESDISLGGWQVVRKAGDQETMYKFHRTLVLKAGSYVTVWSSESGVAHNPPTDVVMKSQKWFTADTMSTSLLNNNGEEMAVRETSKRMFRASEQRAFGGSYFGEELYHQQGDPAHPQERCTIM